MKLKNLIVLGAALMVVAPAVTMLPGCGGGSGSTTNTQIFNGLPVNLGNGQSATLNLTFVGTALTGQLIVPAPLLIKNAVAPNAIAPIPPGTYNLTGTFAAPRGFTANGSYQDSNGLTVNFTLTGQVPTLSREGAFTFSAAGQSVTGTIPRLGQGNPTPTPTPIALADAIAGNITNPLNSNVTATGFNLPLKSSTARNASPRLFSAIYEKADVAITRGISLEVSPNVDLAAGQNYSLAQAAGTGSFSYFEGDNGNLSGTAKNWDSISGNLRIDSIVGDKISFTVLNVVLQARGTDRATGSFNITSASGQARTSFGVAG